FAGLQIHDRNHPLHFASWRGASCDSGLTPELEAKGGSDVGVGGSVTRIPIERSRIGRADGMRRLRHHPAASIASKASLASGPPRYSPKVPSLRTTRWQGTTSGSGLWEHALAAARTADLLPTAFATAM